MLHIASGNGGRAELSGDLCISPGCGDGARGELKNTGEGQRHFSSADGALGEIGVLPLLGTVGLDGLALASAIVTESPKTRKGIPDVRPVTGSAR
jgi:hypothetical protein